MVDATTKHNPALWSGMSPEISSVVTAFTEEQAQRLTGLSQRQLRHWDRTGFFTPSLAYEDRSQPLSRLYTFRDLVSLKVLNALRNDSSVPLSHLREVKSKLAHLGEDIWAKTTLYVLNKRVIVDNPETKAREEVVSGQGVLQIPLKVVTGDMKRAVEESRQRSPSKVGQVERARNVARNQPVVAGTRIPVRAIKAFSRAGYTVEQILEQYPTLSAADVQAAIDFVEAA